MISGMRETGNSVSHEPKPNDSIGRFFKASCTTTVGEDPAFYFNFYQNIANVWQDLGTDNLWVATSSAIGMAQQEQDRLETCYADLSLQDKETVKSITGQIERDGMQQSAFSLLSMNPWHLAIAALLLTCQVKPATALQTADYTFHGSSDMSLCDSYMDCNAFYVTDRTGSTVLKGAQGNILQETGGGMRPVGDHSCVTLDKVESMTADILNTRESFGTQDLLDITCKMEMNHQGFFGERVHVAEKVVIRGFSEEECTTFYSSFNDAYPACIQDSGRKGGGTGTTTIPNSSGEGKRIGIITGIVIGSIASAIALCCAVCCAHSRYRDCQAERRRQGDMETGYQSGPGRYGSFLRP